MNRAPRLIAAALLLGALDPAPAGRPEPLQAVENPAAVQMLVAGFSVRELPLELTNINNAKYRPDGTLVALAYDGKVWLLRDTDGDGLEDQAKLFWENASEMRSPIGMDLTPAGYPHGDGLFVASKTRCVLIADTDHDDRADQEITLAGGWKESGHSVDGLGVAFDPRDGSIYYGRGMYNYLDPLLRDKDGKAQYSITDEAGSIIHVSPDFKSRTIVATGIRIPVGLRLNGRGDLFATDQEGATWVPNGNPFDELLHIQPGRHYGFPSRHPIHLPNVIDEPSTFDYAPQHQSTCGLNFNEPVQPGGPIFGPAAWADEAIVAGYSRGKLFRTQLVKSSVGYVARTHLLACLKMMTVDACISPAGDLVVACHSGEPDWGTGPTGIGKLFKISYTDRDHPQPVFAWAVGPRELRVEFDRPVDPQLLRDVLTQAKLTAGQFVRAGDRFESRAPGYAVVEAQKSAPRFDVPLRSAQLTPDGRTLVLATDPISRAVHYALMLPGMGRPAAGDTKNGALPQHAAIDLDFDLSGCEATWKPAGGGPTWTGWLPHFDLEVSRELTAGSAAHDSLWAAMREPGELTLRGQLDLVDMLRPAVQPGSTLDYEYPPEAVTVLFKTSLPQARLQLMTPANTPKLAPGGAQVSFAIASDAKKIVPVEIRLTTQGETPLLAVEWTTNEDNRPRPLPLRRITMPWADSSEQETVAAVQPPAAELAGGSWSRGYREFFGEQAACAKCHTIYGRGGAIGPNLANLVYRDYASLLRDITHPSFAINPDHLSYTVVLADGRVLTGVVRTAGETLSIGDAKGVTTELACAEVASVPPASVSIMPEGVVALLGPDRTRDLLTFLLTPPPQMPRDHAGPRPKSRTLAEVNAMLAGAPNPPETTRPIRIVLVAGPQDHGPGEHDYPAWQRTWGELLAAADGVQISTAREWPTSEQFPSADAIVFYQRGDWNPTRAAAIDAHLERGGGLVYIHWAVEGGVQAQEFSERIGLASNSETTAYRHGEMTLAFNRATNHPIIRNFESLALNDETYWKLFGSLPGDRLLGTAVEDDQPQPQLWTVEPRKGRVFVSIPGHYSWTFDDPLFRVLLLRGIAWAAGEPVDRFNDLVWPGAELAK